MKSQAQKDSAKNIAQKICWVDELGFLSLCRLLVMRMKTSVRYVKYLDITKCARIFIRLKALKHLFCFEHHCDPNLSAMRFDDNSDVFWRMHEEPSRLVYEVMRQNPFQDGLINKLNIRCKDRQEKLVLFLKQKISAEIRPAVKLCDIIKWHHAQEAQNNRNINISSLVLIKHNFWFQYLERKENIALSLSKIIYYPNIKNPLILAFNILRIPVGLITNMILVPFFALFSRRKGKKGNTGKIAVLHVQGADLEKKSDFFWFPGSALQPQDILVYFRVPYRPLTLEVTQLLKKYGMTWVNLIPLRIKKKFLGLGSLEIYFYPSFRYLQKLGWLVCETVRLFFLALMSPNRKIRMWEFASLISVLYHACLYEAVFSDSNVKVHFSLMEGEQLVASTLAANVTGAVNIGNHWSNYPSVWIDHGKTHDIYFAWGPFYRQFLERDYYLFKYILYSGYPYDYSFKNSREKALQLQTSLRHKGAQFIISFFDEAYTKDDCFSKRNFEDIYRHLLAGLFRDPSLGLIIKPKRAEYYHTHLTDIFYRIKKAQGTGRCIFLNEAELPNMAAQASDLAIGLGVVNTAALEAALAGIPTVALNYGHMNFHPFYKMGLGKIVFEDIESLMPHIRQFRDSESQNGFANYSYWLDQIDPFKDGKASQRIGRYIKWVFDEMCQGMDKTKAIEQANEKYKQAYGVDKIFKHNIN